MLRTVEQIRSEHGTCLETVLRTEDIHERIRKLEVFLLTRRSDKVLRRARRALEALQKEVAKQKT